MPSNKVREKRLENFKEWIKQFKSWDSPIGDFAKDFLRDEQLGDNPTKKEILIRLDHASGGWERPIEVFDIAWKAFKSREFGR